VAVAALLCGGIFFYNSLSARTTLSFNLSLDGKALRTDQQPDVKVDGQQFTSGAKIAIGRHKITVQMENAEPLEQNMMVFYGAKHLGTLPLESSKGSLAVKVVPIPAKVVVKRGGEMVRDGTAPLSVEKLPVGEYTIIVSRGDYSETHSARVQRQQQTDTRIDLKLGGVELSSDPPDAEFELSGNERHWEGKMPKRIDDVPVGTYRLITRRNGWELTAEVSVGRGTTETNKMDFPYGTIEMTSEPSGLAVSTNGVKIGKTPLTLQEIRPGQYALSITDGENDLATNITVGSKEAAKHNFKFRYGTLQLASTPAGATVIRRGKEAGKTPLKLERIPVGETAIALKLDGYVTTNLTFQVVEGEPADLMAKLVSEHYVQAMKQARESLDAGQFADSRKFIAVALVSNPNDTVASKFLGDVSAAEKKAEDARQEKEKQEIVARKEAQKQEIVAIIEKAISAHGGRDALARISASKQSFTSTGKLKDGTDFSMHTTTYSQSPDKIRMDHEIRYTPKTVVDALAGAISSLLKVQVNGQTRGQTPNPEKIIHLTYCVVANRTWDLKDEISQPMPQQLEQNLRDGCYFDECTKLIPLLGGDFQLEKLPPSPNPIPSSIAIKVRKADKPDFTLFFDNESGLMAGIEFIERDLNSSGVIRATIRYSGFQRFSGIMLPRHLQIDHDGTFSSAVDIEQTELYPSLPDNIFQFSNSGQASQTPSTAVVRNPSFAGEWRGKLNNTRNGFGAALGPPSNHRLVINSDLRTGTFYIIESGNSYPVTIAQSGNEISLSGADGRLTISMALTSGGNSATIRSKINPPSGRWAETEGVFYRH